MVKTWLIMALMLPLAATAQDTVPDTPAPSASCNSAQHRQFDFWIGEWNVTSSGQPAGTNRIERILGGCVLQENWKGAGPGGISGSSFNVFDSATGHWHQTWVDSSGTLLLLDGGLVNGVMVLSGTRPARDGSGTVLHRISWTPNPDGTVRQLWEASKDEGESWAALFDGLSSPAAATP